MIKQQKEHLTNHKADDNHVQEISPNYSHIELKHQDHKKADTDQNQEIKFSEIKQKTIRFFTELKKKGKPAETKTDESFTSEVKSIFSTTKKNSYWLIPLILVLIAITASTYLRTMPLYLPITDSWAEDSVYRFYKYELLKQIDLQYPNLPQQNKDVLVEQEFQKLLKENGEKIKLEIEQTSQQFKASFQDEKGHTYLLEIDTYLWYSEARNFLKYGHLGDKIINGESYFSLRDGRLDKKVSVQLHPYVTAYFYKFLNFFNKNVTLAGSMFLLPAILIGLAIIPAFFIGKKLGGNIGGFFAAMFLAVNGPLISRTPAGFSDTDSYNILLPLMITWLFIEAYCAKDKRYQLLWGALAGFFVGVFSAAWGGWSFTFLFLLAATIITVALKIIYQSITEKKITKPIIINHTKNPLFTLIAFFISSAIFVTIFQNFITFLKSFIRPIQFMAIKEVGVRSIWPNVITTVAEFTTVSFNNIINQMGGRLLMVLAVIGIVLLLLKKDRENKFEPFYFIILIIWFAATAYAFTKGTRFAILVAPAFAIALSSFSGYMYTKASQLISSGIHLDKRISQILVFAVLALLLITPFTTAQKIVGSEIPLINDAWYDALMKIKNDSTDAIITSWWDFGHWFVSIAERRTTFDGGDQGKRIHWIGKVLLTDNEEEAIGILRMLNCAQETAPAKLDEFTNDSLKSIQILYQVFKIDNRDKAKKKYMELGLTKEQAEVMLDYTHCPDLIKNYFITSDDMVGKAGVWGHFGSWDFVKATIYQNIRKMTRPEAVSYLMQNFNQTEVAAEEIYHEVITTEGDQWIAPWPGYLSGQSQCEKISEKKLRCADSIQGNNLVFIVDLELSKAYLENKQEFVPNSLVYATKEGVKKYEQTGKKMGLSIVILPDGDNYKLMITDPLQAASVFTKLFFFDGHGMKCFKKFDEQREITGGKIITWIVDFECKQENNVYFKEK